MSIAGGFHVKATGLGKRYNREWIFRNLDEAWHLGDICGIEGSNGAGKSTLLRVLSGFESPSTGKLNWSVDGQAVHREQMFQKVSIAAPYTSLVEELSLREMLHFHFQFKALLPGWTLDDAIERTGLGKSAQRPLAQFSSGMKQRVKLLTALASDTPLVMLDEPTTNLDAAAKAWFQELLGDTSVGRLIFIASNEDEDFTRCTRSLNILDYK